VSPRGLSRSSSYTRFYTDPRPKNPRVFCFTKDRNLKQSEYEKLTDRIVEKVSSDQFNAELSKEQFQQLIQDKIKRAENYTKAMKYIDFIR
jgi:hypothetical protein